MAEILFITPDNSKFYKNKNGFIGLKLNDTEYARVTLIKAFPFSYENKYISVRDNEQKEIGIIKDTNDFPNDIQILFKEELERRYYLPIIYKINSIKDEFGYSHWDIESSHGNKKFTIRRDNNNFINIKDKMILVIDVDGNRYEISDYSKLDSKSYKLIELLL